MTQKTSVEPLPVEPISVKMPVKKWATHYKMDSPRRGLALIFNHEEFDCGDSSDDDSDKKVEPWPVRKGTEADYKNLEKCLSGLGFDVLPFKNLTCDEVMHQINEAAQQDHTQRDCILICVLTHGKLGFVYANDGPYKPESLWKPFTGDKCPTLAGKPKMFFIQACRGKECLRGTTMKSRTETDGDMHSYTLPVEADFLIVYGQVEGYLSWRKTVTGSWFIQTLCEELNRRAKETDLLTILTFVSQKVAVDFESDCPAYPSMHKMKQVPCVVTMLTRLIQFRTDDANNVPNGGSSIVDDLDFKNLKIKAISSSKEQNNNHRTTDDTSDEKTQGCCQVCGSTKHANTTKDI